MGGVVPYLIGGLLPLSSFRLVISVSLDMSSVVLIWTVGTLKKSFAPGRGIGIG